MTIAADEIIQVVISKDQLDDGWWYGKWFNCINYRIVSNIFYR